MSDYNRVCVCVCDCQDDKHRVTSVKSCDLEEAFLTDNKAEVTVIKGNRHYYISFEGSHTHNKHIQSFGNQSETISRHCICMIPPTGFAFTRIKSLYAN